MQRVGMTAAAAALLVTLGTAPGRAQEPRHNPKPRFAVVDSAQPTNEALRAYVTSLQFLSDHVASDVRLVDSVHVIRIDPTTDNYVGDGSKLREYGTVLSRIVNQSADSIRRFALAPKGTTYFWVQNAGGMLRGVLISADSLGNIVQRTPVRVTTDTTYHSRAAQALARFGITAMTMAARQCVPGCPRTGWCAGDTTGTAVW